MIRHRSSTRPRKPQRGIALVTALLVVAVAAIAAAAMLVSHNVAVHRSSNLRFVEQAWWYGAGVENWIGEILRQDKEQDGTEGTDHLGEDWAQSVEYLPIEGGFVNGRIVDQQGCFNLNNLDGPHAEQAAAQLMRLIRLLEGVDPYLAPSVVQSIQDWIDSDPDPRSPGGAEDGVYTGLDPSYRAANQPMQSVSELLLVNNVTPELYQKLVLHDPPHVCAVAGPNDLPINVNTANEYVLASLAEGMTLKEGKDLFDIRESEGHWETVVDFQNAKPMHGRDVDPSMLTVSTDYFLLTGTIEVGNGRVRLYSLILRDADRVRLLAHSKDVY